MNKAIDVKREQATLTENRRLQMLSRCSGALVLASILVSGMVRAETSFETVPVISSLPVYQLTRVETPQQRCVEQEVIVERRANDSATPVIVSTIIGGAIGNAVGHNKSNKRVGAVLGAVLGNSVGRDIARQNSNGGKVEVVERCDTVYVAHDEERLIGYDVTYDYQGQRYTVRANKDPGQSLQLRVNVQPVL